MKEKALRYSYHLDNYRLYTLTRFVPMGLQVKFDPALGSLSPSLRKRWNQVLHNTSIRLIHVLTKHCESSLDMFNRDIARLDAELQSSCPITRYDQFMSEIEAGLTRLESVVCTRRNNKIGNLLHKQKLHRKRRFRQLDKPEAELAVSNSTVINLSSSTLSEAEEKLLSQGSELLPHTHRG